MSLAACVAAVGLVAVNDAGAASNDLIRPFAANSPFNTPIPSNPAIDSRNAAYVSAMLSGNVVSNSADYANAIYDNISSSTPRYVLHIPNDSRSGGGWGYNGLYGLSIPIPDNAVPPSGTDGTVVIVDRAAGKTYYLWQFRRTSTGITSEWPAVFDLNGPGSTNTPLSGRGTGAGITQLAGTIRVEEMRAGRIDHALAFATDGSLACGAPGTGGTENPNGEFRWPATATDGWVNKATSPNCLPYGMRIQVDPSLNFDDTAKFPNMTRGERIIGKALQQYGAYLVDRSGASVGFSFELTEPGEPTWCELGLAPAGSWACPTPSGAANYWNLRPLLENKVRVLADCQCGTTRNSQWTMSGSVPPAPAPAPAVPTTMAPPTTVASSELPAPTGTTVGGKTDTGVSIYWTAPVGAVGSYQVWRGDANWANWSVVGTPAAGTTKFTDTGLVPSTKYSYNVRAVSTTGQVSHASNTVQETTAATVAAPSPIPSAAPSSLRSTSANSNSIALAWNAATGAASYQVWRGDANWSNWSIVGRPAAGVTSFTDTGLAASTKYSYNIRAVSATGVVSEPSNTIQVDTGAMVITAPSNLRSTGVGPTQAGLAWSGVSGATGYQVWRGDGNWANWKLVSTVSGAATGFTDTGLTRSTTYTYNVRAVYGTAVSPTSNAIQVKTSKK